MRGGRWRVEGWSEKAEDEGGFWDWGQTPSVVTGMESSRAGGSRAPPTHQETHQETSSIEAHGPLASRVALPTS